MCFVVKRVLQSIYAKTADKGLVRLATRGVSAVSLSHEGRRDALWTEKKFERQLGAGATLMVVRVAFGGKGAWRLFFFSANTPPPP